MFKTAIVSSAIIAVALIAVSAFFIFGAAGLFPASTPGGAASKSGNGTLEGQVFLAPTCPVAHIPPMPGCAPRPYATKIAVYATNDTSSPFMSFATDASGTFSVSLPAGSYSIEPQSGSKPAAFYPRCATGSANIEAGAIVTTSFMCDTGIR